MSLIEVEEAPPGSAAHAAAIASDPGTVVHPTRALKLESALLFLLGALPYSNLIRLPPLIGFWTQWVTVVFFVLWLALRRWQPHSRRPHAVRPWAVYWLFGLASLTLIQCLSRQVLVTDAGIAIWTLSLAACVALEASRVDRAFLARQVVPFAWGLLVAIGLNAIAVASAHAGVDPARWILVAYPVFGREAGLLSQSNHFGMLAVMGFAASAYLHAKGRLPTAAFWALTALCALMCASSGSRAALVATLAALGIQFMASRSNQATFSKDRTGARRRSALGIAVVLFLLVQVLWLIALKLQPRSVETVLRVDVVLRGELWHDAWALISQHPWIGVGYGHFGGERVFALDGPLSEMNADHAHNVFLQLWVEWGVLAPVGAAAAIVFAVRGLLAAWRRGALTAEVAFAAVWVVGFSAHSMVEHPWWWTYFLLPTAWLLGLLPQPPASASDRAPQEAAAPAVSRRPLVMATVAALMACVVAAADYWRLQTMATSLATQLSQGQRVVQLPIAQAVRNANLTLFPISATMMELNVLELDPLFPEMKLEVARRAAYALPQASSVARYVAFLVLCGRQAEADAFLQMIRRRGPGPGQQLDEFLRDFASAKDAHPWMRGFVAAVVAPVGSSDPLALP